MIYKLHISLDIILVLILLSLTFMPFVGVGVTLFYLKKEVYIMQ